ncbi:ankyrin repeat-containing domain protein [Triangularia verruculosa]|uniref:Ankyrin repeat-containing domain protein n=1 Tax=Triangularia verruculosa TaxID=2587418 RepID=A0AAN7ARM7_9PEZI|nr:ankyrin repeat-containing domain protein [Triangularia verruculosa]
MTPLMFAADQGHDFMIRLLVNQSPHADIRHKDSLGCDAFYIACARGHILCASYLLGCGADINTINSKQNRPLHVVAKLGKKDMVGWLLRMGADTGVSSTQPFDGMGVKGPPLEIAKASCLPPSLGAQILEMLERSDPDSRRAVRYT